MRKQVDAVCKQKKWSASTIVEVALEEFLREDDRENLIV